MQIPQLLALFIFVSVSLVRVNFRGLRENLKHKIRSSDGTACGGMLNTDWEVLYNMPLNEDNFLSECDLSAATTDCEKSDTYDLSVSYSEVN